MKIKTIAPKQLPDVEITLTDNEATILCHYFGALSTADVKDIMVKEGHFGSEDDEIYAIDNLVNDIFYWLNEGGYN